MRKILIPTLGLCLVAAACHKPAQPAGDQAPGGAAGASDAPAGPGGGGGGPGPVRRRQDRVQFQAQAQAGGAPGAPGGPGGAGAGGGRGRGFGGRSLMEADANHDGVVTTDELDAETKARFAEMDANHDGTVTRDEMKAYFQAHRPPGAAGGGADQGPQGGEGPPGG